MVFVLIIFVNLVAIKAVSFFSGNFYAIIFDRVSFQSDATLSTYLTIAASTVIGFALTIAGCYFIGDGTNNGIFIDPTVTFLFTQNAPITILGCSFLGCATSISGYTGAELQCKFRVNNGLSDTNFIGSYYLTTPVLNTIAVAGDYYKMEGNTTSLTLRAFTHADNQLTFVGEQKTNFKIETNIFVLPSALDTPTISVAIAINGTVLNQSKMSNSVANVGTGVIVSIFVIYSLSPNDYIEIFVANESTTGSILATKANLTISEI